MMRKHDSIGLESSRKANQTAKSLYLEVMLKLEGLVTVGALEFAQSSRFVVADHVTL